MALSSTENPVESSKNRSAKGGKKLLTSLLGLLGENLAQNASAKSTMCCLRKFFGRPVLLTRALRAASRIFVSVPMTSGSLELAGVNRSERCEPPEACMRVRVTSQLLEPAINRSLARSILSSGALCFAGDGRGTRVAPIVRAAAQVCRAAEGALKPTPRRDVLSETPARRNNSSIAPSSGNSVGISPAQIRFRRAHRGSSAMSSCIAHCKSMFPAMERCFPAPSKAPNMVEAGIESIREEAGRGSGVRLKQPRDSPL